MPSVQGYNSFQFISGYEMQIISDETFTLSPGLARDLTGNNDIISATTITVDITASGAAGNNDASLLADTFYSVLVIGDSTLYNPTSAVISVAAAPIFLPLGYDMIRRVAYIKTDSMSKIVPMFQYGKSNIRKTYYENINSVLVGGSAFATAEEIDLSEWVPAEKCDVMAQLTLTTATSTEPAYIFSNEGGSPLTPGGITFTSASTLEQSWPLVIPSSLTMGLPTSLYQLGDGADTLDLGVAGYVDYL